jgi:hypothetical protein
MSRLKRFRAALLAATLGGVAFLGTVSSAEAASAGWIYVSLPTWLNNCPGGGSVDMPRVTTFGQSTGVSDYRSDIGDDLVYIRAEIGGQTQFVGNGRCKLRYWDAYNRVYKIKYYDGPAFSQTIYVDRNNQTVWVGPGGIRKN